MSKKTCSANWDKIVSDAVDAAKKKLNPEDGPPLLSSGQPYESLKDRLGDLNAEYSLKGHL